MIFNILEELKQTNSTKVKEQILNKYKDNELLKRVLYFTLSPRIKFYIKKIPDYIPRNEVQLSDVLSELKVLSLREKTGNDAINFLKDILSSLSERDSIIIERIISKDLKVGLNEATVNKVWKGLIETTPYMGAKAFNKKLVYNLFKSNNKVISQVKMDGRYANALINEDIVLESRGGEITHINNSLDEVLSLIPKGYVLNGELTIPGYTRYESNGIIASIISISKKIRNDEDVSKYIVKFEKEYNLSYEILASKIVYTVWDMITMEEYLRASSKRLYEERFDNIKEILKDVNSDRLQLIEHKYVETYEEAMEHFKEMLHIGEEGTIIKSMNCLWKDGKPNEQIKLKLEFDCDLRIVGFNEGTKGTRLENNLGSLICESECGLLKTDPAGITDTMREFIWNNRESLLETLVEVTCSGLSRTENGFSLLHPRFKRLRDDKNIANTLEEIKEIEKGLK